MHLNCLRITAADLWHGHGAGAGAAGRHSRGGGGGTASRRGLRHRHFGQPPAGALCDAAVPPGGGLAAGHGLFRPQSPVKRLTGQCLLFTGS